MALRFKVRIEKGISGYYVASVPSLPGCWSQGRSISSTRKNIAEAISLHLRALAEDGLAISTGRKRPIETTVTVTA